MNCDLMVVFQHKSCRGGQILLYCSGVFFIVYFNILYVNEVITGSLHAKLTQ